MRTRFSVARCCCDGEPTGALCGACLVTSDTLTVTTITGTGVVQTRVATRPSPLAPWVTPCFGTTYRVLFGCSDTVPYIHLLRCDIEEIRCRSDTLLGGYTLVEQSCEPFLFRFQQNNQCAALWPSGQARTVTVTL